MIDSVWLKRGVAAVVLATMLTGCSEVSQAVRAAEDAAGAVLDKAQACGQAISIVTGFDPESLSVEQVKQVASRKAQELFDLAEQVGDTTVEKALFAAAEAYVTLEHLPANTVADITAWVRNNEDTINALKKVCL